MDLVEIARWILVQYHHVGAEPFEPPVLLRLQHLTDERQVAIAADPHQQDRQIARDAVRPQAGLPEDLALRLALATVAGAGELARLSPEAPARLREAVTSPGGTTRAALDVLMAPDGLEALMTRAVAAAAARSRELAE